MRAFAATDGEIIIDTDTTVIGLAQDGDGRVILLPGIDAVREQVVGIDAVKLGCRLVHDAGPGFAAVERNGCAAVIGVDHVLVVMRIDPLIVMIAVRRFFLLESHAAVD